jgi:F-type H+-transporting ATPase subunit epsilon
MLNVHIAKVDKVLFSGEALSVTVPTKEGELTILEHHMPLCSVTKDGRITIHQKDDSTTTFFDVTTSGILEVTGQKLSVLL